MTGFAKGLIISGVLLFLIVVAGAAAGIYWLSAHSGEFLEKTKQSMVDGQKFGRKTDNRGCVTEAVTRYKQSPGFSSALSTELFLQGCLRVSHETPGFCDGIPKPTDFVKGAEWEMEQCARNDLHDSFCAQIFGQVLTFCETKRASK